VVLFDGKDLSKWADKDGSAAKWKVENGYFEVVPKTDTFTRAKPLAIASCTWNFPSPPPQRRGPGPRKQRASFCKDSMRLKSWTPTKARPTRTARQRRSMAQYPPLVNASRAPGQWQTYDIVFHGPRFAKDGKLLRPARETVVHDGVLVQDNVELSGPTAHGKRPPYEPQPEKLPLALQDHNHPVRYRNIWIRELRTAQ